MKAYTDLEQSKKLAEILPIESADMCWTKYVDTGDITSLHATVNYGIVPIEHPCWSLVALFDVLPEGIIENYYTPNLQKENGKYSIAYGDDELLCIEDSPVDACVAMIEKLHKLNLL